MAKSNIHAILGELHKLLATYGRADFIDASKYVGTSRSMKMALRALAHEGNSEIKDISRRMPERSALGKIRHRVTRTSPDRLQLLSLIRRSKMLESTASIVNYANSLGLRIAAMPKDSKDRLAKRLVSLIEKLPEQKRSDVINDLLAGRNSQTEGWIDVIKSGRQ